MRRDQQPDVRPHDRKEWGSLGDQPHPMKTPTRERARPSSKARRAWDVRRAEADRQIRELRARY